MAKWDPIGINDVSEAEDEYDSYVRGVYRMLIARRSAAEIFAYLWWVETENMDLPGDRQATMSVAADT